MIQSKFFIGVVEDINDPSERGRVRVRVFGKHTDNREDLPTYSLPWSSIMMPVTEAGVSGVGSTIGLLPGSWVMGTYVDGDNETESIVLGSLPGESTKTDPTKGFSDPSGVYPQKTGKDTPAMASLTTFASDQAYKARANTMIEKVPTASPAKASTIDKDPAHNDSYFEPKSWDLPKPEDTISPTYPYNNVKRTPGGHTIEYDDTPGCQRIAETHVSGTYRSINSDGSRVSYIKGDDYEIIAKGKNVLIKGVCNITISGDCRQLIQGNYHLEVEGDYTQNVQGNIITTCLSELAEVNQSSTTNIGENKTVNIGLTSRITSDSYSLDTKGIIDITSASGNIDLTASGGSFNFFGASASTFSSGGIITSKSPRTYVTGYLDIEKESNAGIDSKAAGISLVNHVHKEQGDGALVSKPE